jgi:hypothetical protein
MWKHLLVVALEVVFGQIFLKLVQMIHVSQPQDVHVQVRAKNRIANVLEKRKYNVFSVKTFS